MNKTTLPTGNDDIRDPNVLQRLNDHRTLHQIGDSLTDLGQLAREMGSNGTYLFRYLRNDWRASTAALKKLEERVTLFLTQILTDEEPVITESTRMISQDFIVEGVAKFLEHVRSHSFIGIGYGEAGAGKTKACEVYASQNSTRTIYVHLSVWKGGRHAVVKLLKKAMGVGKVSDGVCVEDHLVKLLKKSKRLIIFDNAHRMTEAARRFLADFWEETRCAIALIGNPEIQEQWERNDQHGTRVGLQRDVTMTLSKNKAATARHMLELHLPEGAKSKELLKETEAILEGWGLCRTVEKRAQLARSILLSTKNKVSDPVEAWEMAKTQLPKADQHKAA